MRTRPGSGQRGMHGLREKKPRARMHFEGMGCAERNALPAFVEGP